MPVDSLPASGFRRRLLVVLCAAFALVLGTPPERAAAQVEGGVTLVHADLIAETTAIVPGKAFTVGLRLKMAPHWHTYWQYSGDAGLPTKIIWQLPDGYKAGPIQWPVPEKIETDGDIINYGYDDEVVLLTEITPPAKAANGEVVLKAKADWLVCAEKCVPGSAALSLKLNVGGDAQVANAEIIQKYRALLPRTTLPEGAKLQAVAGTHQLYHDSAFVLVAQTLNMGTQTPEEAKTVDFYPLPDENTEVGHPEILVRDPFFYEIRLPIVSEPKLAARFDGVLVAGTGENRRGWFIKGADLWPDMAKPAASPVPSASVAPAVPTTAKANPPGTGPGSPGSATPADSVWHFLWFGFLGGLLLNVMPCVLPVISLKLFSFVKQAHEDRGRVLRLGLAYAAGVFAWFLGFAGLIVGAKAAGGAQVGYGFQLQNPWFLLALIAVTFVFSLNLLGVFEIILPSGITNAAGAAAGRREGLTGAFLQGLLATVLGSACSAPFFFQALGFALAQNGAVILMIFAAMAAGMSAPFVVLAAFPQWLKFLPKPGAWMERVKQVTGFLMLATVVWLLWTFAANRGTPDAVVWTVALLLVLGAACWVQGTFNTLVSSDGARWAARGVIAALVLAGGWFCVGQIVRSVPVVTEKGGTFAERLASAQKTGRPVFVDFTARWCAICLSNKRIIIDADPVQQAFREHGVVFLEADYTAYSEDVAKLLHQFEAQTVPLYVIYPAGKPDAPVVLPTLLTQQAVLDGIAKAEQIGGKPLATR